MTEFVPSTSAIKTRTSALEIVLLCLLPIALFLLVDFRVQPPRELSADSSSNVFSGERARRTLQFLLASGKPHPAGSVEQSNVRERIINVLRGYGYEPEVQETLARGPSGRIAIVRNVLARARGVESAPAVLLCAHYDSVGAGPGAGDDGAGVAAVLEIARACTTLPRAKHDVIFLISDAEEVGMVGASAFAEQHAWSADVGVVVNLESRGSSGPCMLFESTADNAWLARAMARSVKRLSATSAAETIFKRMPDDTDLAVFRQRGIPGLNFAFLGTGWNNHTRRDDVEHLDPRSLQHLGDCGLAIARELSNSDIREHEHGDAVFVDTLGLALLWWPKQWSIPLAIAACLGVAANLWMHLKTGVVNLRSVGVAALLCSLTLAVCTLAGTAPIAAVNALRGTSDHGLVHASTLRAAVFSSVLFGLVSCAVVSRWLRVGSTSLWFAASLLCCAAGLLSSIAKPEDCYLFVLPSLCAALVAGLVQPQLEARSAWRTHVAVLVPFTCAGLLWFPVCLAMELGFDYELGYVLAGPIAVVVLTLLPSFVSASTGVLRCLPWVLGCTSIAAVITALVFPSPAHEQARFLNLRYIANSTSKHARWEASTFGAELPAELAAVVPFQRADTPPFPWLTLDSSLFAAPASNWAVAAPEWTLLRREDRDGIHTLRGRLRSARDASRLHLHLPPEIRLQSVEWKGHIIRGGFEKVSTQLLFGLSDEGVDVELTLSDGPPSSFWLLDQDWTLPPESATLLSHRPTSFVPRSDGDVSMVGREVTLE